MEQIQKLQNQIQTYPIADQQLNDNDPYQA